MKKRTFYPHNLLFERQTVVNESAMGFAQHFKRGFASLMLTMLSLLFMGVANSATITIASTNVAGLSTGSPLAPGATGQAIFGFSLNGTAGSFTALTLTTSANSTGSISNIRLYNNGTTATYSGSGGNFCTTGTVTQGATSIAFPSISTNNTFSTTTNYYFVICDVASAPTTPFTITLASSGLTSSGNTFTGSSTVIGFNLITYTTLGQTIGLFPSIQGGFENQVAQTVLTATATSGATWANRSGGALNTNNTSTPRTGSFCGTYPIQSSNGKYMISPAVSPAASTTYVVQYYYRTSGTPTNIGAVLGTTFGTSGTSAQITFANTASVWTKGPLTTVATGSTAADGTGFAGFKTIAATSSVAAIDFDDIVIYPGTAFDATVPNDVTGQTCTSGSASNVLSWSTATDQATNTSGLAGYMIVRGTSDPTTAPNVNGIYRVGNTIAAGMTVVGLVPAGTTTFTDNGLTNNTQYFYRIYAVDNAFNYSATGASCNGTPFVPSSYYWNGASNSASPAAGGTGTWGTANNWRLGSNTGSQATWADNTDAILAGTAGTVTLDANVAATSTTFSTTGYSLTTGASAVTLASPVSLGTSAITLAPASSQSLTLSGAISGSGLITVNGSGTAVLSSPNTNTGGVTLTAGTLAINNASALGTTAGTFTINGGSIDNTSGSSITTSNYPISLGGNFSFVGTNALNLGTSAIALTANRTITTTASTLTLGGVISGAFNLTKAGAGTLTLTSASTLTGSGSGATINVTGGTLQLNKTGGTTIPAGTSVAVGSGATLKISTSQSLGNVDLTGGGTLLVDAGVTLTITGTYTPGSGATITNNGIINLNSSGISFPGASTTTTTFNSLTISANTTLDNNLTLGSTGILTFSGSSILDNTGYTLTLSNTSTSAIVSSSSTAYVSGGSLKLSFGTSLTTTNYSYPLGTGGAYLPFILRVGTNGTVGTAATVRAFNGSYSPVAGTLTPSTSEYWSVITATGGANGGAVGANLMTLDCYAAKATLGTNNSIGVNTTGANGTYNTIGGAPATVGGISGVGPTTGGIAASPGTAGTFYLALGFAGTNYYWNGTNSSNNTTNNVWDNGTSLNWATPSNGTFSTGAGSAWSNIGTNIANFANTASGANTVNLAGSLTPYSSALGANYTFATTSGGGVSSVSGAIDLGTNTLTTAPVSSSNLTLSGVISNGSIAQNGTGTTVLSGTNLFTGGVSIAQGALQMGSANALNSSTPNAVIFTSGSTGTLQLNGNNLTVPALNTNSTPGSPIIENGVAGTKTLTIASAGTSTYAGVIRDGSAGALAVTNTGAGTVTLSGNNTYTGATTNSGTGTLVLSGNSTNTGALTVSTGTVTLSGSNTFSGVTVASGATLNINSATGVGANTLSLNSGSIIDNTSGSAVTLSNNNTIGSIGSALTFTGSNDLNLGTGSYALVSNHTLTVNAKTLTIGGIVSAAKNLVKSGSGTLLLTGANTYTGSTTVSGGTLVVGGNVAVSTNGPVGNASGAVVVGDANTVSGSNPTLLIGGAYTFARTITIASTSVSGTTYSFGGSTDNNATFSGNIALSAVAANVSQVATTGSNALTISGIVSGSHSFTKTGAGKIIYTAANTYTGTTAVSGGLLQLNHTGGTTVPSTSPATVSTGATLQISTNQTLASLALSGTGSLIIDNGVTLTVTGAFSIGTGTITGGGSLVLNGAVTGFPGSASATFTNLSLSASSAATLSSSISVTGTLTLGANITLGSNNLTLAQANAISGTGKIVTNGAGDVIVAFPSTASTNYTLPLSPNGISSEPITLTKTGAGTQTYTVSVGTIAFAQSDALNYSWTISTNNGASSVATNMSLGWGTSDATGDLNATPGIGGVLQYTSGAWVYSSGGTIVSTSNTTTLSAVTDFSNSSFTVGKPPLQAEPTNYPTSFTASATASNQGQVTLSWVDATGAQLPSGYLIKGSTVGFGSISAPVDGVAVTTSGLNYNVGYSLETATITGLTENTTYYFKIYPYTNSGVDIDYKTSATAPQVSASTTNVTNVVTDVFRSRTSGNWGTASTWESYDGHSWITASAAPNATSTGGITIQNGHTVSVAASVSASKITINSGGNITVTVGDTLTINHTTGATADLTVAGTLKNQGGVTLGTGALLTVSGTGTYQHDEDGGGPVPTATWAVGSTLNVTGITATNPSSLLTANTAFYNITWNCPNQTVLCGPLLSAGATPVTNYHVYGNFTVNSTGTSSGLKMLGLLATQSVVLTVDGNFSVSNSTVQTNGSGTTGNVPGYGIYNIGGNFTVGSGSTFYFNNGTGNSSCVINMLNGDFSNAGTLRTRTVASDSAAIVFKKSGTQTFTNSGTFISGLTNTVVSVNAGTTLNIASAVTVPALNVASGGTISNSSTLTVNSTLTVPVLSSLTNNGTISGAGVITLTGASQTISGTGTINNLTLNNTTGTTIGSGRQSITGILKVSLGTFNMGSNLLTLKSTSIANSAVVDQVGGTITGTATVERYIPAGYRAYRDMAPQVYGAGSMYNNWQSAGVMTSGSGIFITGPGATNATVGDYASGQIAPSGAGLDYSINGNASAFMYTNSTASWNTGITNTTTTNLDPFLGYRVLVRGDRSFNLATTPIVNYYGLGLRMVTATTLKAIGNIVYGTVTYNITNASGTANGGAVTSSSAALNNTVGLFSLIANPYVCPVQWGTGTATNSNTATVYGASSNINGSYWYMDPTHGAGTYAAYNALTGSVYAGNTASAYIQPGQAVFVQTSASSPSVVFKETAKASSSPKSAVFGVASPLSKIYVSINKLNATTGNQERVDGAAVAFSEGFTNTVYGPQDALKFGNTSDNLSISDKGKSLSIDGRLPATSNDKIQLEINKVSASSYQLVVDVTSYNANGFAPYLIDAYRGTTASLNNGSNTINFTVDASISASYSNRFSIAFKPTTLAVNSITASATLNNKIATISWNTVGEKGVSRFEVEKSTDAKSFTKIGQATAKNTTTASYTTTDNNVVSTTSYYRVKAISEVGTVSYSNIAKLSVGNSLLSSYSLYPNPLKGSKVVNVSLTNVAAGKYTVTINNVLGQRVQEVAISHAGGNGSHAITVNSAIAKGTYSVTIREMASGQTVNQSNLSVN